ALGSQYLTFDIRQPMAALPLVVFTFATGPYEDWHRKAWAASLVLLLVVLILSVSARIATRRRSSHRA
ncbi:MAG: phosphate ABC transporter permease PstA, partial [Gemmatimonadales bacterium]